MSDRPIIFSAPMVRALLDGRKTQTRRVLRAPLWAADPLEIEPDGEGHQAISGNTGCFAPLCLPYAKGDRLWVREACRAEELSRPAVTRAATRAEREKLKRTEVTVFDEFDGADGVRFLADDVWHRIENTAAAADLWSDMFHYRGRGKGGVGNNVPSIHMPRWASRLTLTVTEVRVQRLQEISEADAQAEGVDELNTKPGVYRAYDEDGNCWWPSARQSYESLWNSLHGDGAWDANPWVVAVSFTVDRRNIDVVSA